MEVQAVDATYTICTEPRGIAGWVSSNLRLTFSICLIISRPAKKNLAGSSQGRGVVFCVIVAVLELMTLNHLYGTHG